MSKNTNTRGWLLVFLIVEEVGKFEGLFTLM
jgi:hypothetical protein